MMGNPRHLFEQEALKPKSLSVTLGRLAGYFRPYWLVLLAVLALMIVNTWTQVLSPELTGQAVDCYLTPAAAEIVAPQSGGLPEDAPAVSNCWWSSLPDDAPVPDLIRGLLGIVLVLAGLAIAGAITGGLMFYSMTWAGQHVLRRMQMALFDQFHRLSLAFYSHNESGQLMSRVTNDVGAIQQAFGFALIQVLGSILLLVWIGYTMLALNFVYGLLSLSLVPIMAVTTMWFSGQARKAYRKTRQEIGNVNAELEQSISGVREVQAFSREDANIESFRASNAANRDANVRAVAYSAALAPSLEGLGYVAMAIVAGVGGYFLITGRMMSGAMVSMGLIITYLGFVQRFNQPIAQISVLWTNLQSAIAGVERIFELLDELPDIEEKPDAIPMPAIQGRVVFDHVSSEYEPGEQVLKNVSLVAEPGQTIAIVGPTGAGKSTLVNLLPRFYDVTGGAVTIDGIDVRDVQLASLRSQIGMVLQDTFLFADTVINNIRYGRPGASDEEVVEAAKAARAHDFIERLPEGYQTVLGERGSGLSQGQRQLLSIARAALAQPRLLILDEATSSVDTRTERQIQAALESLLAGRTSFVIAHRLSTIRHADEVLLLAAGEIVERGRHEELLAQRGRYYDLYMSQFARQEATSENGYAPADVTDVTDVAVEGM